MKQRLFCSASIPYGDASECVTIYCELAQSVVRHSTSNTSVSLRPTTACGEYLSTEVPREKYSHILYSNPVWSQVYLVGDHIATPAFNHHSPLTILTILPSFRGLSCLPGLSTVRFVLPLILAPSTSSLGTTLLHCYYIAFHL